MAHWRCISDCGACCRLDPAQRGDDLDCLDDAQRSTYLAMVGEDGWCIHFDTGRRRCRIYDTRPDFCRVENLMALFSGSGAPPGAGSAAAATECGTGAATAHRSALSSGGANGGIPLEADAQALAIASCRTQIRAEYGGRGRVMRRFEQAIRRTP